MQQEDGSVDWRSWGGPDPATVEVGASRAERLEMLRSVTIEAFQRADPTWRPRRKDLARERVVRREMLELQAEIAAGKT